MKKILLLLATLAAIQVVNAQTLRSQGPVPADLKMSVQQLYDDDLKRAKKYAGGRVKNKQQVLEASYSINKMLAGGHIVYGDPISRMLERIADTLLVDYPELRSNKIQRLQSPAILRRVVQKRGNRYVLVRAVLVRQTGNAH